MSPAEASPAGLPSPAGASPLEASPLEASPSHASPGSPGSPSAQALSQLISSPAWQTGSPPLEGGSAHVHRLTPYSISVSLSPTSRVELSLTSPLRNRSEVSSSSVHPSCRCGRNTHVPAGTRSATSSSGPMTSTEGVPTEDASTEAPWREAASAVAPAPETPGAPDGSANSASSWPKHASATAGEG